MYSFLGLVGSPEHDPKRLTHKLMIIINEITQFIEFCDYGHSLSITIDNDKTGVMTIIDRIYSKNDYFQGMRVDDRYLGMERVFYEGNIDIKYFDKI